MTPDTRRRALHHAAAAGDDEAAARLLVERRRAGEVTEPGLRLAAALGDEPARLALDGAPPARVGGDLRDLLEAVDAIGGARALVRAAVAAAERVQPLWARASADPTPRWALEAATAWARCPCPEHRAAARAAADRADEATLDLPPGPGDEPLRSARAAFAARAAGQAARVPSDVVPLSAAQAALEHARDALHRLEPDAEAAVGEAVRAALLAWALRRGPERAGR